MLTVLSHQYQTGKDVVLSTESVFKDNSLRKKRASGQACLSSDPSVHFLGWISSWCLSSWRGTFTLECVLETEGTGNRSPSKELSVTSACQSVPRLCLPPLASGFFGWLLFIPCGLILLRLNPDVHQVQASALLLPSPWEACSLSLV
jgi:hypothetical protein